MKRIVPYFLCILFFASACSSSKDVASGGKKDPVIAELSNKNKIAGERLFFDAQREKMIGNINESKNLFEQSLKQDPSNDAAYFELAQIVLAQSDYRESEVLTRKAIKIDSENTYYQEFLGNVLSAQYKYGEAAEVFGQLREKKPQTIDYYFQHSYFLTRNDQLKEALVVFNELEEKIGLQEGIAIERHKIYLRLGKVDEAENELVKLIKEYPDEEEYQNDLAEFYLHNGKEEEAVATYLKLIEQNPDNAGAITSLADYYKKTDDNANYLKYSKMAFENYNIPIDAKISVLFNYIQFYEKKKDEMDDAYELADILVSVHKDEAKAFAVAGDLRNVNDEPEKALPFYEKSLELRKDIYSVWQQIFFIHSDNENYEDLKTISDEAKEYFPNQPTVYFFNGLAKQQLEELEEAAKSYEKGVKMTLDNKTLKAQFHSNLGDVYNTLKQFKSSDSNFEKALEMEPNNAYVLNNYSYYLSLRKANLDHAAEMSELSNKLTPDNPSFLDTYAWILYQQKKYSKAAEWQQKAIDASGEKPSATLYEHLGDILYKLGRQDEAVQKWQAAIDAGGDSSVLLQKVQDKQLYE